MTNSTNPQLKWTIIARGGEYDGKKLVKELEKQLRVIQGSVRYRLMKTVDTWEKKPKFFVRKSRNSNSLEIDAGTENELWGMLDLGTEPHTIQGKQGVLAFPTGYTAKTQPRVLGSSGGGFANLNPLFRDQVHHPGTKARQWTLTIADEVRRKYAPVMQDVILEWVEDTHARGPKK